MNTTLNSFRDLKVWQKAMGLGVLIYDVTERFPKSEIYGLSNQMRRAIVSVSSNIAEGFRREHMAEKVQFYNIAYGSLSELESQLEISFRLKFISKTAYEQSLLIVNELSRMMKGFIRSIRTKSAIKNAIIGCILLYSTFYILHSNSASAATLFFSPPSGQFITGKIFTVNILVSSDSVANAMSGVVNFPVDKLTVVSLSTSGSIINFWAQQPTFANESGKINFEGVILGSSYKGQAGKILAITFKAKAEGSAALNYSGAVVLAYDGKGTDILTGTSGANYTIEAPIPVKVGMDPTVTLKKEPATLKKTPSPIVSPSLEQESVVTPSQPVQVEIQSEPKIKVIEAKSLPTWYFWLWALFIISIVGLVAVIISWWQARYTYGQPILMRAQIKSKAARIKTQKMLTRDRQKLARLEKELALAEAKAKNDLDYWRYHR